jgi:hypothetical protein
MICAQIELLSYLTRAICFEGVPQGCLFSEMLRQ